MVKSEERGGPMTILAIFLLLTTIFFWWRARVWKRQYHLALNPMVSAMVSEFTQIWADGFREQQRDQWPEEIER